MGKQLNIIVFDSGFRIADVAEIDRSPAYNLGAVDVPTKTGTELE
jgi:hypothetical protein